MLKVISKGTLKKVLEQNASLIPDMTAQLLLGISTQNFESAATTPPATTHMSRFYLIPESDLFVCEIWICSLYYLYPVHTTCMLRACSVQSQICLAVRFGFVHCFIWIC